MKKWFWLGCVGIILPLNLVYGVTALPPIDHRSDRSDSILSISSGFDNDKVRVSQFSPVAQSSLVGPLKIGDLEFQLWDMGEVWEKGHLLDLITVIPPDVELQEGPLWVSYGLLGIGKRWHQEVHSGIEVKNALAQNEVLRRLLQEGASLIESNTPYQIKEIKRIDLSGTSGKGAFGILFKLGNSTWLNSWENWVMILPHFEVGKGTFLEIVTLGTHSDKEKATELAKEIANNVKNALSGLICEVNILVSDDWQVMLKRLLFPDKEELGSEETAFYEAVKKEWLGSGLSEEEIRNKINEALVLLPLIYEQVFYSPLVDTYLYDFSSREERKGIRYRRMLYEVVKNIVLEGNKLSFRDLRLGGPKIRDLTYSETEEGFMIGYDVTGVEENSISFPLLGLALKGMDRLSFEIKSSTSTITTGRVKTTTVEASPGFQIGFRYIDEQGKEQLVLKRFDELAKGITLSGEYQKVEIELTSFGDIPWDKVTELVFYFNTRNVRDKRKASLYFKDMTFSPQEETTPGRLAKDIIFSIDAKKYLEEKLQRPLILSILEDRTLLMNFSENVRDYLEQGYSQSEAYQKAKEEVTESNLPNSLIPFIEELMFSENKTFSPETLAFDQGMWNYWLGRLGKESVSSLKRELAIDIFMLPHLERLIAPPRVEGGEEYSYVDYKPPEIPGDSRPLEGKYLYPDVPFLRYDLDAEGFLEIVGMGYLKYFKDTRDPVSGLWFDNSMEIGAEDPVISLPAIAGGLLSIPLLIEYGFIDKDTGYEWANKALDALINIQREQKNYMDEFLPYLEEEAAKKNINLEGLTLAQKMQRMESIRIDTEVKFLETKGISFNDFLQRKGIELEELTPSDRRQYQLEFLRENSPMFKYGWGGFLYRYMTREELPQRKIREDLVNDLSIVDTSYIVYSALTTGQYFKTYYYDDGILEKAKAFYDNIVWEIFLDPFGTMPNLFNMGWLPEKIGGVESGYLPTSYYEYATDEGLMIALLASISRIHPVCSIVLNALHREWASYAGGPEFILSPTGALFTYNLLDLWLDFSSMNYSYPEGEVNWDMNRRIAVLTNWRFAQDMAKAGVPTFDPYAWSIDTGYTPSGLRMDQGFAFKVVEDDSSTQGGARNIDTTTYRVYPIGPETFFDRIQEPIIGLSGYGGSALNSLRALLSFRKVTQTYYKLWGEYGVRDSFGCAEDILRGGGFIPNVWNSYDQMRALNIFNLLGKVNGKPTPRDLFMSIDFIQQGLENFGFRKIETVKPVEISLEQTEEFRSYFEQNSSTLISLLYNNDFNAVFTLQKMLEEFGFPMSEGDFEKVKDTIATWRLTGKNESLIHLILAMTDLAEVLNIAKAACGDSYQSLIEGRNVDVASAIVEYAKKSDSLFQEALSHLRSIDESLIPPEMVQLVKGLKLVIYKNSFAKLDEIINAFGWFKQVTEEGINEQVASIIYKYDYDGELFGVYTTEELIKDPEAIMKIFTPLRAEFNLEPTLPEETGILSHFAKQVDGHSLADILEEVYIQSALKPYAEKLLGRPLDVTNPDGKDAGFLAGLAAEVKGGFKDGPNTLEEEIEKLQFIARCMVVHDKARGSKHDLARDPRTQDQLDILGDINLMWEGYSTGKYNLLKPWQGIPMIQSKSEERPLLYFATSLNGSALRISEEVKYQGVSSVVIDKDAYQIPIILGNWYLPNQLKFGLRGDGSITSVRLIIINKNGEEACYRIDNVGDSWKDIEIPLWGPYWVPWMSEEENAQWQDWLTREFWRKNADGTFTLKADPCIVMEYDRISDWRDIVEIRIEKTNPSTVLYLGGIYSLDREEKITDIKEYLTITAQPYFAENKAIVLNTKDGKTLFVVNVRGDIVDYIQVDPPISPTAAQGFWDFRRSLSLGEYKVQTMKLDDFIELGLKDRVLVMSWL